MSPATGSLLLEAHKRRPMERPIVVASAPEQVFVALDQGSGRSAAPSVREGDIVRIGSTIATACDEGATVLHAPIAGRVRGLIECTIATASAAGLCISIENDGSDACDPELAPVRDWLALAPADLARLLTRSGIAGLGGAAFPIATKLADAVARNVGHLLVNGAECEPWICCDDALMRERADEVTSGARMIAHAIGATKITIAIEDDKPEAIAAIRTAASGGPAIDVSVLPARYPAGAERTLATAVTGREVPTGALPSAIGVLCQNAGTVAAVAQFVTTGVPLTRRVVTVTGSGVCRPANVDAVIGTPISRLVAACDGYTRSPIRLIAGGTMTGRALATDAVPLIKGLNCVIAATTEDLARRLPERPCIRCGECARVCPALLLPQQIHRALLAQDLAAAAGLGLDDCIECGACDYVCPSQIPLTERFRSARACVHRRLAGEAPASHGDREILARSSGGAA